ACGPPRASSGHSTYDRNLKRYAPFTSCASCAWATWGTSSARPPAASRRRRTGSTLLRRGLAGPAAARIRSEPDEGVEEGGPIELGSRGPLDVGRIGEVAHQKRDLQARAAAPSPPRIHGRVGRDAAFLEGAIVARHHVDLPRPAEIEDGSQLGPLVRIAVVVDGGLEIDHARPRLDLDLEM